MYLSITISLFCLTGGVLSSSLFSPCKVTDLTCIEKSVNAALPQIFDGVPELGIEASDPQFNDIIEINHPTFKLSLINSTFTGFKNCAISNLRFNIDFTNIYCNVNCQKLELSGKYEIKGRLIRIPIEGSGDVQFTTGTVFAMLDTEVKKIKGSDGKSHVVIKGFKVIGKPIDAIKYQYGNLFNGQKVLSDDAHKYMEENWLAIAELLQYPIWYKNLATVARNVNKYLEQVALEEILLQATNSPNIFYFNKINI